MTEPQHQTVSSRLDTSVAVEHVYGAGKRDPVTAAGTADPHLVANLNGHRAKHKVIIRSIPSDLPRTESLGVDLGDSRRDAVALPLSEASLGEGSDRAAETERSTGPDRHQTARCRDGSGMSRLERARST